MVTIKAYRTRQYYLSKYGEKLYTDSDDSDTAIRAAELTGKGLESENELVYTAYGETKEEALNSLENFKKANNINEELKLEYENI